MKLKEMFDRVLIESGHFLMKDDIELDIDKFAVLVKACLGKLNQYAPHHERFTISISYAGLGGIAYTFDKTFRGHGEPDWISDVIPVRLAGVNPFYFQSTTSVTNSELEQKRQFPWDYIKPNLYVPIGSVYEITAVWNHKLVNVTYKDPNSTVLRTEMEVTTIGDKSDQFFKILQGRFMQALGRNRRAFTLNDIPVTMDSADLVSEGQAMEQQAEQDLADQAHKFWLAYR